MRADARALLAAMAGVMALAIFPLCAAAQSTELLIAYRNFETARAANDIAAALNYAKQAADLAAAGGEKQTLPELLRNLGDYSAQVEHDALARGYYMQALKIQETELGTAHPDLLPVLGDIADLAMKDQRYQESELFLKRTLAIERAVYGERHQNTLATLAKLRTLYLAMHEENAAAQLEAQLRTPIASSRGSLPNQHYKQKNGFATVRVFYGTNRASTGNSKPADYYGSARGELQYGYLDVTIPQVHQAGDLETQPRWVEYTFAADPTALRNRYVLLDTVAPLSKDDFVRALREQVQGSHFKDVFIFVHGFNNTFEDAARRAAQLAYDLDFDGTPLMYSWPSQGSATAYAVDEASVGISGRKMTDFLETVMAQSGAQHVHLIAHSMGNVALIEALQNYLARRTPQDRQHLFGQIVFTAPDVDRDYFSDVISSLGASADRVTLYASDNDYAIRSSQFLHGAPRAGTAGDVIVKLAGLDSIDMSAVPADALGHSYFAANAGAIYDIFRLLWRGDPPPQRCGMSNRDAGGTLKVWRFNAEACKGEDLLEAGVMLKRYGDLARARVISNIATLTDPSQKRQWSLILQRLDGLLPQIESQTGGSSK